MASTSARNVGEARAPRWSRSEIPVSEERTWLAPGAAVDVVTRLAQRSAPARCGAMGPPPAEREKEGGATSGHGPRVDGTGVHETICAVAGRTGTDRMASALYLELRR